MNKNESIAEEVPKTKFKRPVNYSEENEILSEFAPRLKGFFRRNFDELLLVSQIVIDFLTILFSFQLSYFFWEHSPLTREYTIKYPEAPILLLVGVLYIFTFLWAGTYQKKIGRAHV